jgi:hypothetical protein
MDHDDATEDRLPAVRLRAVPAPVDRAAELVRAAGSPLAVPLMAAGLIQATASAMTEAIATMTRPWLVGWPVTAPPAQEWSGPGVHVSYTHVEVRWPTP